MAVGVRERATVFNAYNPGTPITLTISIMGNIEMRNTRHGQFYFRIKHDNGHILCHSESYTRKDSCIQGIVAMVNIIYAASTVENPGQRENSKIIDCTGITEKEILIRPFGRE